MGEWDKESLYDSERETYSNEEERMGATGLYKSNGHGPEPWS